MADINHSHAGAEPVEGDGISYPGIVWFVAILAITTIVSQLLMVATFKWLDHDFKAADAPRAPLAAPIGQLPPSPNLLYLSTPLQFSEPGNLEQFREKEDAILKGYSYDKASGAAQIPIDRAKDLLLQRGLPTRDAAKPAAAPAAAKPAVEKKPTPAPAGKDDHHEGHEDHEGL
jgi:hypothetical protein